MVAHRGADSTAAGLLLPPEKTKAEHVGLPLSAYKVGHKVRTPLTLPSLPAPLHSWGAAAWAAAGGLQPGAPEYARAWGRGQWWLQRSPHPCCSGVLRMPPGRRATEGYRGAEPRRDLPPTAYLDAVRGGSPGRWRRHGRTESGGPAPAGCAVSRCAVRLALLPERSLPLS